jgi:hypothetical protein
VRLTHTGRVSGAAGGVMTRTTTAIPATTQSTSATTSPQPVRLPPGWLLLLLLHDSYASLPTLVLTCQLAAVGMCTYRLRRSHVCGASTVRADGRCRAGRAAALHSAGVCSGHWPPYGHASLTAQSTCKCSRSFWSALPGSPRPGTLLQHFICGQHHVDA